MANKVDSLEDFYDEDGNWRAGPFDDVVIQGEPTPAQKAMLRANLISVRALTAEDLTPDKLTRPGEQVAPVRKFFKRLGR